MKHGAIDVHKQSSQVALEREDGIEEFDLPTDCAGFVEAFGRRRPMQILIESSTESEWVATLLESLGHRVIVADPNFSAMYATRSKGIKTNRRDARALLDACRSGVYRAVHRRRRSQRFLRQQILLRQALVRSRSRLVGGVRSLLRQEGLRIASGSVQSFVRRVRDRELPRRLRLLLTPVLMELESLNERIEQMEEHLFRRADRQRRIRRLCSVPGVGPISALAYAALIDDPQRFTSAESVRCYLGLVPREDSSADYQHRGSITKAGNSQMRWLLVQDAWGILRSRSSQAQPLQQWARAIAARRGSGKAVVALARKLAGVLWAMDLKQEDFHVIR